MTENIITTDNPLTAAQQATLSGILSVLIPADERRGLQSANELDLVVYINEQSPEFVPALIQILETFDDQFAALAESERHQLVDEYSKSQSDLFNALLFHTFACYYQDDRVLEAIGMNADPPFPRGNEIESGDLSLLDPVLKRPRLYRT